MISSFSGREVPSDKLFVLYYPPTMVHYKWDKSVYAAARAEEALKQIVTSLRSFYWRYVVRKQLPVGIVAGLVGLLLLGFWVRTLATTWVDGDFFLTYLQPVVALVLLWFARSRVRAFLHRSRLWKSSARQTVSEELDAIEGQIAKLSSDPSAEEAAAVLRRQCPEVISEIAFQGSYFHAFTYMDFVMYPRLKHPGAREELPSQHSLNRDAYYVGDVVYDGWRPFQKDHRELIDPRFVGSGGRRGVI